MKAVNLIPGDARRSSGLSGVSSLGPSHLFLGLLALAVAFVTVYVLTGNTISQRQAKLGSLQTELAQDQAQASQLTRYVQFDRLAQQRASTVRQILSARFNWEQAMSDLSKVVPANTSLQSLTATDSPNDNVAGAGGAGVSSSLRGDSTGPAFELSGCTDSQDDVAQLISRLRLINGVTRVTLGDSQKSDSATAGASVSAGSGGGAVGCRANGPTFDLIVFFAPIPGAAALAGTGSTTTGTSATSGTTTTSASATTTTTATPAPTTTVTTTVAAPTPAPSSGAANKSAPGATSQLSSTPATSLSNAAKPRGGSK